MKTFTLITTSPNELGAQIHDRMPAILERTDLSGWLDPDTLVAEAMAMLKPFPAAARESNPVRPLVTV